ncbi:MAG: hypothetical protein ACLP7J_01195 [Streptosporangiaceae bacterium]
MTDHPELPGWPSTEPAADELMAQVLTAGGAQGSRALDHRAHVHLAFLAVRRCGMPVAVTVVGTALRHAAAAHGAPQKFHATMTRAWTEAVAHHVTADPSVSDFDAFARRHPALLDKRLLMRHYRAATLATPAARAGWAEPDLAPFPWAD